MYLKSIDVHGFKSFANKMTFEFHNGITGIVGPNGSGKSNVADAVRWVLGEQSAKQLRGGNMQDVIFSGTETRKPQGFAYVAITMDNSDHKLDVEYEEVTVARRIYRSGESEYLINGASCRLKDINELFYDTGIGKEGYSIIGQGQIDKILSGKPEERRELFDEAAGIVKFKRRKSTAIKKLEEEKRNLVRVTDILSELTKQLGPLERQSETARIYLKKKDELKQLDANMFLLENKRIKEQLEKTQTNYSIADKDLQSAKNQFEETKLEYERLEEQLAQLEMKIEALKEKLNQNTLSKQQLESQIDILNEQIHAAKVNDEHYKNRMDVIQQDMQRHKEEIATYLSQDEHLEVDLNRIVEQQEQANKSLEETNQNISQCKERLSEAKNELIDILNKRSSTKGKMQRYDAMLEQIEIRKSQLSQRVLSLKSDESRQNELYEEAKIQFEQVEASIKALLEENASLEANVNEYQAVIGKQNQQIEVGQTAYHREASRLESLKNLTERYDGYGNSIRKVMEQKQQVPGIKGVVADLIQVSKKYEIAVETALGGSIQNVVTDNEQTAKQMIQFLKQNKYGRATFLPITTMYNKSAFSNRTALKEEGVIGLASDLVTVSEEFAGLAVSLLGRTVVVDHIDHAIVIARKYKHSFRMVTLEGELLNTGGSMTGGAFKNNSNLLGRRREIEELSTSVAKLKEELQQMQVKMETDRKKRNALRDRILQVTEQLQKQYILQNTAKMNRNAAKRKVEEIKLGYSSLHSESSEIEQQIYEVNHNSESIRIELNESMKHEHVITQFTEEVQAELEEYLEVELQQKEALEAIRLEYANIMQKAGFNKQNRMRLEEENRVLQEEHKSLIANLDVGAVDVKQKEDDIQEILKKITSAKQIEENEQERLKQYTMQKEKMAASHKSFFEKRDELSERMNLLDKECFRLNNQKEKLEEKQEQQTNYLWEEYELTPIRAQELRRDDLSDYASIKQAILDLKDGIRRLGSVNVNAIEDYKEVLERHTFLSTQYEDLVTAEETLKGIIEELDIGMRKQFEIKFQEIRREFDKAFKELFGGGKGTIELDEEEADILEAGIRIISQPPGKKLQNMMQLSGGEKALTAIALLFAIQNLKPSPFCLLDEIEAALDDSNVTRYAQYLHKLTKNTQFIIITHRRGTMNAADRLYGITMQEKGVSTLVSVNLIQDELDK